MLSEKMHSQSPITPTHFIESKWRHNRLICMSTKYKQSSLNIFRGVAFTNCHGRTETIKYYKTCRIGLNKKQTSWILVKFGSIWSIFLNKYSTSSVFNSFWASYFLKRVSSIKNLTIVLSVLLWFTDSDLHLWYLQTLLNTQK